MNRRLACLMVPLLLGAWAMGCAMRPAPPAPTSVRTLDQGWSGAEAARYHTTPQGTLLLPLAWVQSMHTGILAGGPTLIDGPMLAGLRFLTDGVAADADNPHALPIGWTVQAWASPDGTFPALEKVGFSCAACHTGQLDYRGQHIRIEGAGALHDAAQYQETVAVTVIMTAALPWKRVRFVNDVARLTGQTTEAVAHELDTASAFATQAAARQLIHPLYPSEGYGRLDALQRIANTLLADDLKAASNNRVGAGPVKFPYLWDIWRLDWVQYNASVRQPMVRNVGEALGVRAETNFAASGPARWQTSVMVANLQWMEGALQKLRPPVWPEDVLGARDPARYAAGRTLFAAQCAGCHGVHVNAAGEWRVTQVPLEHIGTDPNEATGFITHRYDATALGLGASIDTATALRAATERVKDLAYDQLGWNAAQRAAADGFGRPNQVVANAVYKARPLVGVWASPPYLHNGSVPSLYDLLSPVRPTRFPVGTREYDPVHVGYSIAPFPGAQERDTTQTGNANTGHWFADDDRTGRIGRGLSEADRLAIIEYLKFVPYEDYPCTDAATGAARTGAACGWRADKRT